MDKTNKIYTKEYYVASIDLLGMKTIIKSDINDVALNNINEIYESLRRVFNHPLDNCIKIKFFSDNCVVAIDATIPSAIDVLLDETAWICSRFLVCGYKPRGGISVGRFYMNNTFVWGQGLVNAYMLESKIAKYPRIIIDENIVENISNNFIDRIICKDFDDKLYLNYFRVSGMTRNEWLNDINEILNKLNSELESISQETNENDDIKSKLEWLLKFVNENKLFWENHN